MRGLDSEPRLQMTAVEREIVYEKHLSLRDFGDMLRRRKSIALATFFVVLAIGLILIATTKPLYEARTRILVEGQSTAVAVNNADNPLSSLFLPAPSPEVDTQVEVLQSANLIQKVGNRIGVDPKSVRVGVRQLGKTDLAELTVTSHSSQDAEKFAAELPKVYLQDLKRGRMDAVTNGLGFARKRLAEKTAQLEKAEQELRAFKSRSGVVDPTAERTQDITATAEAQAAARQAVAEADGARARLEALQATRSRLSSTVSTPVTVTNPEVGLLKDRIASLREERARQLFLFKPGTDEIRRVDVNIAALQRRLASTPATLTTVTRAPNPAIADLDSKIADNLAQYRAARASWYAAAASASRLQNNLSRYNAIEMRQAQLQRAIDQGRSSVEMLSRSVEEMSLRERAAEAAGAPVKVVGATGPAEKIAPRVARSLIVTLLLASLLACMMAFIRDSFDSHIKSEEEARATLQLPVLGHLPGGQGRQLLLSPNADISSLESYRMLRSNLQFALAKCPERAVQVTSSVADEGKTRIAANLAMVTALDNWRVILVDADLRNPQLHNVFNLASPLGLVDVLAGRSTLEEALQPTSTPNLRVLGAGRVSPSEIGLLNSPAMDDLLLRLNAGADFVFFDSPPSLSAADAQLLASKVDGVLYVMELGQVEQVEARRGMEQLQNVGAFVLGMALSNAEQMGTVITSTGVGQSNYPAGGQPVESRSLGLGHPQPAAPPRATPNNAPRATQSSSLKKIGMAVGVAAVAFIGIRAWNASSAPSNPNANSGAATVSTSNSTATVQVMDVIGQAEKWRSEPGQPGGQWQAVTTEDSFSSVTGIRTGPEAALLLQLGQSGVLRVGENTSIKIRAVRNGEYSVKVNEGKVWGSIRPAAAKSSLQVRTPAALVNGANGVFSVASGFDGALTMVSTHKGNVSVRRGQRTVPVAAGQALRVARSLQVPMKTTKQQAPARQMWAVLQNQESWIAPGGAMQLDQATVYQISTASKSS